MFVFIIPHVAGSCMSAARVSAAVDVYSTGLLLCELYLRHVHVAAYHDVCAGSHLLQQSLQQSLHAVHLLSMCVCM